MTAYKKFCGKSLCLDFTKKSLPKDQINAVYFGVNVSFPVIGDNVNFIDRSVSPPVIGSMIVNESNYVEAIQKFVEYQKASCFQGDETKDIYSLPYGTVKGTRPKWTSVASKIGDEYEAKIEKNTNATNFQFFQAIDNQCFLNELQSENPRISEVDFLENGMFVMNYGTSKGKFINKYGGGGIELTGSGDGATGSFDMMHKGDVQPCFVRVEESKEDTMIELLKNQSGFTFNKVPTTESGLTPLECSSRSNCIKRESALNTAFAFKNEIVEKAFATCLTYSVRVCKGKGTVSLADYGGALQASITINPLTGELIAPTGLPVGDYTFEVTAKNACCVEGSYCVNIVSK